MSNRDRLPPNQQPVAAGKWPIVGERHSRNDSGPWSLAIGGCVGRPTTWTLRQLAELPQVERAIDIHCVTRWSKFDARFGGVPLADLLNQTEPASDVSHLSFVARSDRAHSSSLPRADALQLDALIALRYDGRPLEPIHGGPIRLVVPGRYFYKSVKWLESIEALTADRLGFWESDMGYHNTADPWAEQRYVASNLDRQQVSRLIQSRDFSGHDLLGIEADGRELSGLRALGAVMRDARLTGARLQGACFDGANLSNARLQQADLRDASFCPHAGKSADLEGADFRGADLRGATFENASLFGASFCGDSNSPRGDDPWGDARLDSTTCFDAATLETLATLPAQQAFVLRATNSSADT